MVILRESWPGLHNPRTTYGNSMEILTSLREMKVPARQAPCFSVSWVSLFTKPLPIFRNMKVSAREARRFQHFGC